MSARSRTEPAPGGGEQVRRATEADLEALTALWIEITRHHRDLDPLFTLRQGAEEAIRSLLRSMLEDPGCGVFVSEPDGEVVGICCVRIDRAPPILREVERAEITDLGVRRDHRRRGLGRMLAEVALTWVRERAISRVEVRVVEGNREAQAFWRALGFGDHVQVLQRSV
jgi:ribosomal protein S18 acetylase RimI-like enzyme